MKASPTTPTNHLRVVWAILLPILFLTVSDVSADWDTFRGDYARTSRSDAGFSPNELRFGWSSPDGYTSPIIVGDTVVAIRSVQSGSDPRLITAFDLSTGLVRWSVPETEQIRQPAAIGGRVYYLVDTAVGSDLNVRAVDSGSLLYRYAVGGFSLSTPPTLRAVPGTADDATYYASYGSVSARLVNATSATPLWSSTGGYTGYTVSALTEDAIVHSSAVGAYATRLTDGQSFPLFFTGISSGGDGGVAVYDAPHHRLFVSDPVGQLHAFDYQSVSSITPLWTRNDIGSYLGSLPMSVAADGSVYALPTAGGRIVQIDPVTGQTVRSASVNLASYEMAIQGDNIWLNESTGQYGASELTALSMENLAPVYHLSGPSTDFLELQPAAFGPQQLVTEVAYPGYRRFDVYVTPEPTIVGMTFLVLVMEQIARRRHGPARFTAIRFLNVL